MAFRLLFELIRGSSCFWYDISVHLWKDCALGDWTQWQEWIQFFSLTFLFWQFFTDLGCKNWYLPWVPNFKVFSWRWRFGFRYFWVWFKFYLQLISWFSVWSIQYPADPFDGSGFTYCAQCTQWWHLLLFSFRFRGFQWKWFLPEQSWLANKV